MNIICSVKKDPRDNPNIKCEEDDLVITFEHTDNPREVLNEGLFAIKEELCRQIKACGNSQPECSK